MIQNSFIFLDKVKGVKEKRIWEQGIHNWFEFLDAKKVKGFSKNIKEKHNNHIMKVSRFLEDDNVFGLSQEFPFQEHWRLFERYKNEALYLDIETSGYYGDITMIGLYDGEEVISLVKGYNLDKRFLQKIVDKHKILVTFNGASFDLPIIRKRMGIKFSTPHVDLRFVCQKVGLSGGLKSIEKHLGIKRKNEVASFTGCEAMYCWNMYRTTGNKKYLKLLIDYNREDVINLEFIMNRIVPKLWKNTFFSKLYK